MKNQFKYRVHYNSHGLNEAGIKKMSAISHHAAVKAVDKEFGRQVLLTSQDIETIQKCLQANEVNSDWGYHDSWRFYEIMADIDGFAFIEFSDTDLKVLINVIEQYGDRAEDYETLYELTRWYGVKRDGLHFYNEDTQYDDRKLYDNTYDGGDIFTLTLPKEEIEQYKTIHKLVTAMI